MFVVLKRMIPFGCLGLIALALCAGARPAAAADDAWKAEWDKTLAAAKKEGKLVLYMRRYDAVLKEFSKKYPEIKPVVVTGEGPVLGTRIVTERRAEKYLVDLYVGGPYTVASTLLPAEAVDRIDDKLLLPEVLDTSSWVNHEIRYSDPERKYNLAFLANPGSSQISYNSTLVDPKTITSYQDFLDPKWKGKIVSIDPTDRHIGGITQFIYYNPNLGPDFFRKLFGEMDVTYARNVRQMTDWLAAGKFALCLGCLYIERAKQQGLPVGNLDTTVYKEGASFQAGSGSISLIKQAPNPNAAKLFINWLLSREGQMVVQKTADNGEHMNSGRIDIPKDDVDRDNQLVEGEQYFDQNSPEWADIDKVDALSRQIMATKSMQ